MKNTILRNSIVILAAILLPALMGAAQAGAVEYKSTYRGIQNTNYRIQSVAPAATAPAAAFQSTSAYSSALGEEDMTSTLNADGSVNESNYIGRPRRVIVTPGDDDEPGEGEGGGENKEGEGGDHNWNGSDQPLGDALIPLALLTCAYAIYKVSRRRKEA